MGALFSLERGVRMATDYSKYNQSQYDNQSKYLNDLINKGGGNAVWAQSEMNKLNSQYQGGTQSSTPSSGGSGTVSSGSGNKNTGVTNTSNVNSVNNNAFISPGSQVAEDGTRYHSWGENDQYTRKDYLSGNADLQYALEQWMKNNGTNKYDIEAYVKELYGNVGQDRGNGTTVTLADVDKELDRLGLSDYNSQNVTHTAGGNLIPNNPYVTSKEGSFGGSNSEDSKWLSYGGQDYLVGGDSANYVDYVNGKTGNTTLLDLLFDNMQSNPYAQGDASFMQQYNQQLNDFNSAAGITPNTGTTGGYTGNTNVDAVINYVNSLNNYNSATGGNPGTTNLLDMLQGYLDGGLQANKEFLAQQKSLAEQQAQQQASDAYVNQILQGDAMKQMLSAQGLGTSGALQSALLGVQGNYNNNLNEIQSNLNTMLSGLSEQELMMLTDYYNNMANYAYQVSNDEADRAYKNAQLALQQQQQQYDQQMAQQQLALQLQQLEYQNALQNQQWGWEQQQYEDAMKQQEFENNITLQELLLAQQKAAGGASNGGNTGNLLAGTGNNTHAVTNGVTSPQYSQAQNIANLFYTGQKSYNPMSQLANALVENGLV